MSVESSIVEHYGSGDLLTAIEAGLDALGKTASTVTIDDLGPVDEFHIGGRAATSAICERLGIGPAARVLDVGCGIGGTARLLASTVGCQVMGVDLAPGYIDVARTLTDWTALSDQIGFEVGSALDLPFGNSSFDAATLLHVGMNIEDKVQLFTEIRRVLRPDGALGVYDVMRTADGELSFPVPWASDSSTSFVSDIPTYEAAIESAGLEVLEVRNRRDFALDFFATLRQKTADIGGPPPLGLNVIIGSTTAEKIANLVGAITDGAVAPVEIICRAR